MTITLHDRAPLEKVRRLADGRIAAVAKVSRSGIQQYLGRELDPSGTRFAADQMVNVYRPEAEVFDEASMASFAHRAVTLDHPDEEVNAGNWKKHSVGYSEGRVARNGDFIEIPLMLADASAVAAFDAGTNQLSAGYSCDLIFGTGVTPSGEAFAAKQVRIRSNHIALVRAARAGPEARIGDTAMKTETSIDVLLQETIAVAAKNAGQKPSEWLATQSPRQIQQLIETVANKVVASAGAAGIAGAFKMDAILDHAAVSRLNRDQIALATGRNPSIGGVTPINQAERKRWADDAKAMRDSGATLSKLRYL